MTVRPYDAPGAPVPGHYSQAVEVSGETRTVHVSGQVPIAPDGSVPEGFDAQMRLVFRNIEAQLAGAGLGLGDIVKITSFLSSRENVAAFRAIRSELLGGHKPASTLVMAELIDPAWLLEVEVVAAR